MASSRATYTIGGVKIHFPCKAYPSQLAMMNSIIRGLNNGQHCLLESPTGSGKSLALLCSALGWQQAQFAKRQEEGSQVKGKNQSDKSSGDYKKSDITTPCQCFCHSKASGAPASPSANAAVVDLTLSPYKETSQQLPPAPEHMQGESQLKKSSIASRVPEKFQSPLRSDCEKDNDFQPEKKRFRTAEHKSQNRQHLEQGVTFLDDEPELENKPLAPQRRPDGQTGPYNPAAGSSSSCSSPKPCSCCPCDSAKESAMEKDDKKQIPKIFFGTRTHKQITQIAHELKRTVYSSVPMTILSSRDHTCINKEVAPHANRNERCKDLLKAENGLSCRYYHGVHKMRDHYTLQQVHGLHEAWDIEDLVALGKQLRSCSYYAARELMQGASIIFCPYNYLLDPMIRESMEINLAGQILVLDEAHNIEDCARESASFTLDHNSLLMSRDELDSMVNNNIRKSEHEILRNFCYILVSWIQESKSLMSEREYEVASKVWSGNDILGIFNNLGITADTFCDMKQNLAAVLEKEHRVVANNKEDIVQIPVISSATSAVLKNLFMVLDFLYRDKCRFADDYRVALQRTYAWVNQVPPDVPDAKGFFGRPRYRQRHSIRVKTEVLALSFWCLNPAVAFSDLSESVHSIVLTSGTLSPMGSFSSELGVKFSIQLEASHVINKSQVWVGTVGAGPQGRKLCATFQHAETYVFQDEVGALLLHVCQVMAKGVLCFLPSYRMLDNLRDRWAKTGVWKKLEQQKTVITEPRGGGKGDFDDLLQIYYDAIRYCEERSQTDGALLIAVCRGKVSEGLDFTDDNARAVVTIGIPFPNIKDLQVELKMKYNDQHCKSRGLLPGHHWYEIQAYRALNQALGRCIRHRNDWGALILVDDRYRNNPKKYITGLSKWVRQLVQHHDTFSNAIQSLEAFSRVQQKVQVAPVDNHLPCSTSSSSNSQLPETVGQHCLPSQPHTPHPCSRVPEPQQDTSSSSFCSFSHTHLKAEQKEKAECLKMTHSPPAELLSYKKRIAQPLYQIFTSSSISTCFKRPLFHEKASSISVQHLEKANYSEHKVQHKVSVQKETEVSCLKQEAVAVASVFKVEPHSLGLEPFILATCPTYESHPPSADKPDDEEDKDQTIFTPERFEDGDKGSPQKKMTKESPPRMVLGADGSALLSEESFGSEQPQGAGQASAFNGQTTTSVSKESTELSQGQKQGEESEQVDNQSRQAGRRLNRLSRSRQRVLSTPTGN